MPLSGAWDILPWALEVHLVMQRIKTPAPTPAATAGASRSLGASCGSGRWIPGQLNIDELRIWPFASWLTNVATVSAWGIRVYGWSVGETTFTPGWANNDRAGLVKSRTSISCFTGYFCFDPVWKRKVTRDGIHTTRVLWSPEPLARHCKTEQISWRLLSYQSLHPYFFCVLGWNNFRWR